MVRRNDSSACAVRGEPSITRSRYSTWKMALVRTWAGPSWTSSARRCRSASCAWMIRSEPGVVRIIGVGQARLVDLAVRAGQVAGHQLQLAGRGVQPLEPGLQGAQLTADRPRGATRSRSVAAVEVRVAVRRRLARRPGPVAASSPRAARDTPPGIDRRDRERAARPGGPCRSPARGCARSWMAGAPAVAVFGKAFASWRTGSGVVPDLASILSTQVAHGQQY